MDLYHTASMMLAVFVIHSIQYGLSQFRQDQFGDFKVDDKPSTID